MEVKIERFKRLGFQEVFLRDEDGSILFAGNYYSSTEAREAARLLQEIIDRGELPKAGREMQQVVETVEVDGCVGMLRWNGYSYDRMIIGPNGGRHHYKFADSEKSTNRELNYQALLKELASPRLAGAAA